MIRAVPYGGGVQSTALTRSCAPKHPLYSACRDGPSSVARDGHNATQLSWNNSVQRLGRCVRIVADMTRHGSRYCPRPELSRTLNPPVPNLATCDWTRTGEYVGLAVLASPETAKSPQPGEIQPSLHKFSIQNVPPDGLKGSTIFMIKFIGRGLTGAAIATVSAITVSLLAERRRRVSIQLAEQDDLIEFYDEQLRQLIAFTLLIEMDTKVEQDRYAATVHQFSAAAARGQARHERLKPLAARLRAS